uniref:Potassium transporter n=1 Tax=Solanum lycopersicum TaxID=4081 RepID=A0A3Q7J1B7_SOLLC
MSNLPPSWKALEWSVILKLAFQSIGVVYGDIGTSPLFVFATVFPNGVKLEDDILGALSLIFYTITLIPLIKYVFIVLQANDNGDGGTFALYSLICRYSKVGLIPSQQPEDKDVSTFKLDLPDRRTRRASKLKSKLENSNFAKFFMLIATMLVLSAVGGLKAAAPSVFTEGRLIWIAVAILILLFMFQRFGTENVGNTFASILSLWFIFIAGIGIYNMVKYDPTVIRALNPKYIIDYFKRNKKNAWISLGGVVMSITGGEALFADVGHFSVLSIQISMCCVTYPALILAYLGQAAFLMKNIDDVADTFYKSIPHSLYWPVFIVAVLAAIIASQALISGTFSIIQQSLALGCFPRVKVVHTSAKHHGQVYIPEINNLLMLSCVIVTLTFRTTEKISNAYGKNFKEFPLFSYIYINVKQMSNTRQNHLLTGIAVVLVMVLTSCFLVLVMIMIWKTNILFVIIYVLIIGTVELIYLSSVLYKFDQGGYLPLAFALFLMCIMYVWNYVYRKKYHFELEHKISPLKVKETVDETNYHRLPGLAIFYSELVHGIPPIFKHYVDNVPALHSVLVFFSVKSLPINKVPVEERFLFRSVKPCDLYVFRCVVRYGYNDVHNEEESFERLLAERLKEYIQRGSMLSMNAAKSNRVLTEQNSNIELEIDSDIQEDVTFSRERDIKVVERAYSVGVVHFVGEQDVIASKGSGIAKRVVINYVYNFLKRNVRQSSKVFDIPHKHMLKVGMIYEL